MRALVVDDSASMRQLVSFTLQQAGHEVIEGANGQEALAKLNGSQVGLVVTDLNMPVMDGISLIKAIRSRAENRFTPILVLTTDAQEARKREGQAAGATGWMVKPFHPRMFLQAVDRVLPH